jgi:hypothetical protein
MGGPRWWNHSIKSQQLFSHLCVVKHCHSEGEAAACEDELFEVMLSAVPVFHITDQS